MKQQSGFTVIEIIFVVLLLGLASVIFFIQKNNIEVTARDTQRKTAINAMYYGLEEVYYKEHKSYPRVLDEKALPSIDSALFSDPNGIKLGQTTVTIDDQDYAVESNYRYEPTDCTEDACKSYTLRSTLENEADFEKTSRNK
jgi:type II secretory pathway pseudopilin PulG